MGTSLSISRREALRRAGLLSAGVFAARTGVGAEAPFGVSQIDHVEFFVSNVERSVTFYARLFGNTVLKNNRTTRRYVKLGPAYIAIDTGQQIQVDHFCAGVPGFEAASAHSLLDQRGVAYRDYPSGRDLAVTDPDGTRLQFAAAEGWGTLPGSPESIALAGEPIFKATGIDHILLNVSDPEKSTAFFEKVLGPVTQRNNNRIWFQAGTGRIGLLQTPAGQKAGVNHYCVSTPAFDYAAVVKRLEGIGIKADPPEVAGAPEFRDPDGYRVQVMTPRAA